MPKDDEMMKIFQMVASMETMACIQAVEGTLAIARLSAKDSDVCPSKSYEGALTGLVTYLKERAVAELNDEELEYVLTKIHPLLEPGNRVLHNATSLEEVIKRMEDDPEFNTKPKR